MANSPGDPAVATFSLALTDEQEQCAVSKVGIEGSEVTSRIVQMASLDQADLLDEELEFYSRDTVYEECLTMVGAFIRGTKHATRSTPISHKVPSGEPISASQAREQRTRPIQRPRN